MAQEIGVAYVTVAPSARGFGKSVEGEIDQGVSGATKKADGRLKTLAKNTLKWGGAAVLGIGAAITGLAVKGGISRALNIEDAQAKLRGLGHDTQAIDQIMTDALASVRGTAYGLDSAATTAAAAVASGIEPGKELERYLKLTADAATIAGVSMDEMGSIINKTTAKGRVSMEDLNRLTERGVPILQMLADEYGVTAEEMSKMVSSGEVDAERFRKALEDNVGGAALESGNTVRGAFANMGAALSRLGLTFVQPLVDNAQSLFTELTTILDGLNDRLAPFAEKFSEWFGDKIGGSLDGFGERFLGTFDKVADRLRNFDVGDLLSDLVPKLSEGIRDAANWLANGGIKMLADGFLEGRAAMFQAVVEIVPVILEAIQTIIPALGDLVVQIVSTLVTFVPLVIDTLVTMIPALLTVAMTLFETLIDALTTVLPQVFTMLAEALPQVVQTIAEMAPGILLGAMEAFTALIEALAVVIPELLTVLTEEVLPQLIDTFITMGPPLVDAAIVAFMALVTALTDVLPILLDALLNDVLPAVIDLLIANAPELLSAAFQMWGAIQVALATAAPKILRALWDMLWSIVKSQLNMTSKLAEAARTMFQGMLDGSREKFADVLAWVREIPKRIKNMFSNAGNWLVSAGKAILNGLLRGIRAGFKPVEDALRWVTDKIPDWKGPADLDARLLTGNGRLIMDSLIDGFKSEEGAVRRYLQGFTSDLAMAGSAEINATGAAGSGLNRSDLDYLADRIAHLMGLESERGTSRAFTNESRATSLAGRMA